MTSCTSMFYDVWGFSILFLNKSNLRVFSIKYFMFISVFWPSGKHSVDADLLNSSSNNNNHKWPTSCANLLQNSINCINNSSISSASSTINNNNSSQTNNNNNLKPSNHLTSMTLNHNMQTHHHHHALSSALSSPFSSLLGASGGAGYLLDPLGNLQKSAASNHLFWTWSHRQSDWE